MTDIKFDFSEPVPQPDNLEDAQKIIEALEIYLDELNVKKKLLDKKEEKLKIELKLKYSSAQNNVIPIKLLS